MGRLVWGAAAVRDPRAFARRAPCEPRRGYESPVNDVQVCLRRIQLGAPELSPPGRYDEAVPGRQRRREGRGGKEREWRKSLLE